jgi:hypothetical protein
MHQKIINYFILAIAFLINASSIKALSQQIQKYSEIRGYKS